MPNRCDHTYRNETHTAYAQPPASTIMISDPDADRRVVARVAGSPAVSTAANTTGLTMSYSSTKK